MPNISSFYDGTVTVDLDNGCNAVIRKYLSEKDFREAQAALLSNRQYTEAGQGSTVTARIDTSAFNRSLVHSALVSWNLTDERDRPLKIDDKSLGELPNLAFRKLLDKVLELNKEVEPEVAAKAEGEFRDDGENGDRVPEGIEDSTAGV